MDNAEPGPGPSTARIKFTLPAGSRIPIPPSGPGAAEQPPLGTAHAYPNALGPRGGRGRRRGRGTGSSRSRGGGIGGSRHNPPRHSSVRASNRISQLTDADHADSNSTRRLTLSFNKNGTAKQGVEEGRKTSFLGEYDRDLDENPTEPLAFEEQFILRVPESIAGGLREMVKGKTKGLEGVEFKFLGTYGFTAAKVRGVDSQIRVEQHSSMKAKHMLPSLSICQTSSRVKRRLIRGTYSKLPTYRR
jgi:hypothetical protein